MKKIIYLLTFLFSAHFSYSQSHCYSHQATEKRFQKHPDLEMAMQSMKQNLLSAAPGNSRGTRTISVVVHVVYNTTAENVSTASINNLINTLNADYSATNNDLSQVRSAFTSVIGNPQIQFCLDTIIRKSTTKTCFDPDTETDDMKFNSSGGSSAINNSQFLNIWIVDLCGNTNGGVAGYAYLGTSGVHGSSIDGLVIDYSLGYNNGLGRTATHEIGHYFGLEHPWADDASCSTDDGFTDTPPTNGPNYFCSATIQCSAPSPGTQYENFMDYCSDPHMFTTQQANYMNQVLTQIRSSLLNSSGCSSGAPTAPVADFTSSTTTTCPGGSVQFTDASSGSPTSWSWSFQGGTPSTSSQQNPTITYNTPGTYNVTLTVSNSNGSDAETKTGYIVVSSISNLPLAEGFQGTFLPTGWGLVNPGSDTITWRKVTNAGGYGTSSSSVMINNYDYSTIGAQDLLLTPIYNFTNVNNGRLTFDYAYARYSTNDNDSLAVLVSLDCGENFYLLQQKGGASLATVSGTVTSRFVPTSSQWKTDTISLAVLAGEPSVQFGFLNITDYGQQLFLDNINIANVAAAPVANFVGNPLTIAPGGTVNFTDLSTNSPTSWSWSFPGSVQGSSTLQNPTGIQYNTVGTYTVTLNATNAQGVDSEVKTNYITVTNSVPAGCDTLTNINASTSLYSIPVDAAAPVDSGYLAGHNVYGDLAKADKFSSLPAGSQITGGLFYFVKARFANANSKIKVTVWDANGTAGAPGTVLGSKDVNINTLSTTAITSVTFASPITINGAFYMGIELTYAAGDTVALAATDTTSAANTAWEKWSDATWHDFTSAWNFPSNLAIFPITCTSTGPVPVVDFSASATSVCAGSTVTFTDNTTNTPTSWAWTFAGGTPSTSTSQNPTVTYNTPGTYNVTLIAVNANGRDTLVKTGYIVVRNNPTGTVSVTNVTCFNGTNGSINLTATGGTAPYTYRWSNSQTTEDISGLSFGSYTVTITDANGCTGTATGNISQPTAITIAVSSNDATCNNANGSATASATGGSAPYTFNWSNGLSGATTSGLAPGVYTVTLTDAQGCIRTASTTVTSSGGITVTANGTTTTCGNSNGTATAVVTGGTAPYTYAWNNNQSTANLSNLAAGTYTVTVTSASGCSASATATVSGSTGISVSTSSTQATCGTSNGSATVNPTGGSGYTYLWSNGGNSATIANIPAGNYQVTVTATGGCTATGSVAVTNVGAPTISLVSSTNVLCNGGTNGAIDINVTGGTSPYTYSWSNGQGSQDLTGLAAGTYLITVTAANNCIATQSYTINQPTALTVNAVAQNISCFGGNNGSVTLNVSGGTPSYTFNWNNASTNQNLSNLGVGNYAVTVSDANGCQKTTSASITQPSLLSVSVGGTNPGCGLNNGLATASATGGTGSYSYLWSNNATTSILNNLGAGTYSVIVTDANGCTATASTTLSSPSGPSLTTSSTPVSCGGTADGSATVNVVSGQTPYTYSWSNGQTSATNAGIAAGSYTVTVSDGNNCSTSATVVVSSLGPNVTGSQTDVSGCNGDNTGSITVLVSGGTSPYTYNWSSGQTNASIFTLTAGTYTVTVTDQSGCQNVQQFFITEPDEISVTINTTPTLINQSTGSASLFGLGGGTPPYSYQWSTGATGTSVNGLAAGSYSVAITDDNNCVETFNFTITSTTGIANVDELVSFKVYPNPNSGKFSVSVDLPEVSDCKIEVFNVIGELVFTIQAPATKQKEFIIDLSSQASANYYVKLSSEKYNLVKKVTKLN
ncbi:MAG: PKD domain-containing protein [Chitinophagales bacterium]|nr:PKD domain-containing protein [Chitinophagales bacterium]